MSAAAPLDAIGQVTRTSPSRIVYSGLAVFVQNLAASSLHYSC